MSTTEKTTIQAQAVEPGQTVRFKRWDHKPRSPRITVEVDAVDTFGRTTVITGRRVTPDASGPGRTKVGPRRCFSMNPDAAMDRI